MLNALTITLSLLLFVVAPTTLAHPGNTDSSGGHTCRTNCSQWGYGYGAYHYHNTPTYRTTYRPEDKVINDYKTDLFRQQLLDMQYTNQLNNYYEAKAQHNQASTSYEAGLLQRAKNDPKAQQEYRDYVKKAYDNSGKSQYEKEEMKRKLANLEKISSAYWEKENQKALQEQKAKNRNLSWCLGVSNASYDYFTDTCNCNSGYIISDDGATCISAESYCKALDPNSYYDQYKGDCWCKSGFLYNSTLDKCTPMQAKAQDSPKSIFFGDVDAHHPNANAIHALWKSGKINGYNDGTFKPERPVTRAEALKILLLASNITPAEGVSNFSDIDSNHWSQKYIKEAVRRNIVKGFGDGSFKPNNTITAAEAFKMAFAINGIDPGNQHTNWFVNYMKHAENQKWLPYTPIVYNDQLTRGALVEIMHRISQEASVVSGTYTN